MTTVTIKNCVTDTAVGTRDLVDIIDDIRLGAYKEHIDKIRYEQNDAKKDILKKKLLAFAPCIQFIGSTSFYGNENVRGTGLVQYDIDHINMVDAVKLKSDLVGNIDELVYAFISPSGGLKFAVNTDFNFNEKPSKEIKEIFKNIYNIIKTKIKDKVKISNLVTIDESCSDVGQLCYVSYDKDAHYNNNATMFNVYEKAKELYDSNKPIIIFNDDTPCYGEASDDTILNALETIPRDVSYKYRRDIMWSLMSHYGDAEYVEKIMMAHWDKKNKDKLRNKVNQILKDYKSGYFRINTLFHFAKENNFKLPSSSYNKQPVSTVKPAKYDSKLVSLSEGKNILDYEITDFFKNKISKVIDITAGSGKTQKVAESIVRSVWGRDEVDKLPTIAIYVSSGDIADDMYNLLKESVTKYISERGISSFQVLKDDDQHYISIIKGRKKIDCEFKDDDNVADICKNKCQKRDICSYINQYSVFNNIRIYTHSYLFSSQPKSYYESVDGYVGDKKHKPGKWVPDYVIIDEDIIASQILSGNEIKEITFNDHIDSISKIINDIGKQGLSIREAVKNNIREIELDCHRLGDKNDYKWFNELLDWSEDLQNNELMNHSRFQVSGNKFYYFGRKYLREELKNKPILLLDASSDEMLVNDVFDNKFKYVNVDIEYQSNVEVIQLGNKSYSKSSITDKNISELKAFISNKSLGKKFGVISYQYLTKNDKKAKNSFVSNITKDLIIDDDHKGYFGNARASNKFKDLDMLFIIGRQHVPSSNIDNMYRQLYGGKSNIDGMLDIDLNNSYFGERVVRMSSGNNMILSNKIYANDKEEALCKLVNDADTYQAFHRLRLLYGNNKKTVYLLTDRVINVTVDKLIPSSDITGIKTRTHSKTTEKLEMIVNTIIEKGSISSVQSAMATEFDFKSTDAFKKFKSRNNLDQYLVEHGITLDKVKKLYIYNSPAR